MEEDYNFEGPDDARPSATVNQRGSLHSEWMHHADSWVRQQNRAVFTDANEMKAKLRDQLSKPEYNVAMYYKESGWAQKVARSHTFEHITLWVIAVNAFWISIDTDYNPAEVLSKAPIGFQVVEQLFCFYFVGEWAIRFLAFKNKLNGLRDGWFVFDTLLALLFVIDSWVIYIYMHVTGGSIAGNFSDSSILRVARLLRLTRMARMARLLRAMPELIILIKGMGAAMRSVGFTLILLLILLYIFGVAFRQLCSNPEEAFCNEFFSSVPRSMHSLLIHGTLMDDLREFVVPMEEYSIAVLFFFYFFLLLAALTVMNMLIGVLCDVVNTTAAIEKESLAILYVKDRLMAIMIKEGMSNFSVFTGEERITKEEFLRILENKDAAQVLADVGVDVVGVVDCADFIFKHDMVDEANEDENEEEERVKSGLSFPDFVEVLLQLRGNNSATVRDIVDLRKFIQLKFSSMDAKLEQIAISTAPQARAGRKSRRLRTGDASMSPAALMASIGDEATSSQSDPKRFRAGGLEESRTPVATGLHSNDSMVEGSDGSSAFSPSKGSADQRLEACERKDVALGTDFRQLVERLVLEHEAALGILQRGNERLQAELDVLKSLDKTPSVARGKGEPEEDFSPDNLGCLRTCFTPRASQGEHLVSAQGYGEEDFTSSNRSLSRSSGIREQRPSAGRASAVLAEAKAVSFNNSVNNGNSNNLQEANRQIERIWSDNYSRDPAGEVHTTSTRLFSSDAHVDCGGNPSSASSAKPAMPPMPSASSSLSTLGNTSVGTTAGPLSSKCAIPL